MFTANRVGCGVWCLCFDLVLGCTRSVLQAYLMYQFMDIAHYLDGYVIQYFRISLVHYFVLFRLRPAFDPESNRIVFNGYGVLRLFVLKSIFIITHPDP